MDTSIYIESIADSIARILRTAIGSRVMEPEFGSNLYLLVDKRADERWRLLLIRYTFEAIERWEPRVKLQKATPKRVGEKTTVLLEFEVIQNGEIGSVEVRL